MDFTMFDIMNIPRQLMKNPHFARTSNDRIAFSAFLLGGHLALWYEVCHVLPYYYTDTTAVVCLHYAIAAVLYVNCLANMYMVIRTRTCRNFEEIVARQRSDWSFCAPCQGYFPPRTHHCKVCNMCVLKRDHHCWFAGCCVGHHNHRYYFSLIIYMWLASLYACAFHFVFVGHHMGGFGLGTWLCVFVPHMAAICGFLSLYQFLVATFTFIALFLLIMMTWLLQIQISQMCAGQTANEVKKTVTDYDLGYVENIREIFGENWKVAWMSPWIRSPLPGDGVTFRKSSVKDKDTYKQI